MKPTETVQIKVKAKLSDMKVKMADVFVLSVVVTTALGAVPVMTKLEGALHDLTVVQDLDPSLKTDNLLTPVFASVYEKIVVKKFLNFLTQELRVRIAKIPSNHAEVCEARSPKSVRNVMLTGSSVQLEKDFSRIVKAFDNFKVGPLYGFGKSADFGRLFHQANGLAKEAAQYAYAVQAVIIILVKTEKTPNNILSRLHAESPCLSRRLRADSVAGGSARLIEPNPNLGPFDAMSLVSIGTRTPFLFLGRPEARITRSQDHRITR